MKAGWRFDRRTLGALLASACVAGCSRPEARAGEGQAESPDPTTAMGDIDHLRPARDSVGPQPTHFEWTAVEGADRYAIGVWNEVDVLQWRADNLKAPRTDRPEDVTLQPGTYFWEVVAIRAGRQIAMSGRAAFVVRDNLG